MKKLNIIFIAIFILVGIVMSQQAVNINKAPKNYLQGLNHFVPGIVESSITGVMELKKYYPELDFSDIIKKLDDLAINGETREIRIKAFIATNYLKNPESFNWIKKGSFSDDISLIGNIIFEDILKNKRVKNTKSTN